MATDADPARASSDLISHAWWFRFLVRTAFALLAFWTLSFAADRFDAFTIQFVGAALAGVAMASALRAER